MKRVLFSSLSFLLSFTVYASYQVELHGNPNCKDEALSSHTLTVEDGCQTHGVGIAQGASLLKIKQDDSNAEESEIQRDTVLFYTSPDCNSTSSDIIASSDIGCIAIGSKFHTRGFQSFRLVSPEMSKAGERMGWKANNAALLGHGLTWEDLEDQGGEMHGCIFVTGGKVYKYQQLSKGSWTGVTIEDWDDEVHIKHDEV